MPKLPVFYQIIEGQPVMTMFLVVDMPHPKPTSAEVLEMLQDDDIVNAEVGSLSAWKTQMGLDLSRRKR